MQLVVYICSNIQLLTHSLIIPQGEFLLHMNSYDPPFDPPPLPDPSAEFNNSKMIYIIATNYVAETALYAYWKAGYLTFNKTVKTHFDNSVDCYVVLLSMCCDSVQTAELPR